MAAAVLLVTYPEGCWW